MEHNCIRIMMLYCRQAADSAGFNVLRLIHEPSAALLAYGIGQDSALGKRYSEEFYAYLRLIVSFGILEI